MFDFFSYFTLYRPFCNRQHGTFLHGRTHIIDHTLLFEPAQVFITMFDNFDFITVQISSEWVGHNAKNALGEIYIRF